MAYFAAYLEMQDRDKNLTYRPQHLEFLKECEDNRKLYAYGPLADGSGGLVIYIADSYEEAERLANRDPYVIEKVRRLHLREWKMTPAVQP